MRKLSFDTVVWIIISLALVVMSLLPGCGPARNALHTATPTAPPAAPCTDGARRCNGLIPERCTVTDGVGRWYPLHPLGADLRPAPCALRCVVDDDGAHCAGPAADAGADAAEGGAP